MKIPDKWIFLPLVYKNLLVRNMSTKWKIIEIESRRKKPIKCILTDDICLLSFFKISLIKSIGSWNLVHFSWNHFNAIKLILNPSYHQWRRFYDDLKRRKEGTTDAYWERGKENFLKKNVFHIVIQFSSNYCHLHKKSTALLS